VNRKFANLTGLRVVDCSIVPTLLGGNTNAPAIMIGENSAKAGWRRSALRPLLCSNSLLTGNLTGNFAKMWPLPRRSLQLVEPPQGVRDKFPTHRNRELFSSIREFWRGSSEFLPAKLKSSADEVFGTHTSSNGVLTHRYFKKCQGALGCRLTMPSYGLA